MVDIFRSPKTLAAAAPAASASALKNSKNSKIDFKWVNSIFNNRVCAWQVASNLSVETAAG